MPSTPPPALSFDLRALVAAAGLALLSGHKVAGLFDHAANRHRRLAAEHRRGRIEGLDGDLDVRFGGTLPELASSGGAAFTLMADATGAHGHDRRSATAFHLVATGRVVQLFDHGTGGWSAYTAHLLPADG